MQKRHPFSVDRQAQPCAWVMRHDHTMAYTRSCPGMATLVQARSAAPRLFGTTDSALKLLHKLGVRRIVLDKLDEWQPEQAALQKRSRPDRAQALSRAAEYDRWVNAKVQSSRDDPRPAVAEAEWQAARQAKLAQRQHPG